MIRPHFASGLAPTLALVLLAGCSHSRREAEPSTPAAVATAPALMPMPSGANPVVGGAAMMPTRTIAENAAAAPTLSTLVSALNAAGLAPTLTGPGPYTVFAPTNAAFARLAPGTVDQLMLAQNKPSLVKVLTYHVVPGTLSSAELIRRITAGGGSTTLTTLEGDMLTATMTAAVITLTDVNGNHSYIETADVRQANGLVHVVNGVLVPRLG